MGTGNMGTEGTGRQDRRQGTEGAARKETGYLRHGNWGKWRGLQDA